MSMGIYCVGTSSFGGVLPSQARATQPKELVHHNRFPYWCNNLYYAMSSDVVRTNMRSTKYFGLNLMRLRWFIRRNIPRKYRILDIDQTSVLQTDTEKGRLGIWLHYKQQILYVRTHHPLTIVVTVRFHVRANPDVT